MAIWNLLRDFAGIESGRSCRACTRTIVSVDRFGQSEGVCRACRAEAST